MIKAVLFDLDDTLLWDHRSIEEAFEATCLVAKQSYAHIDVMHLQEAVRNAAKALYSSYPTYDFTKMIGINPFEGLWARFTGGELPEFRELEKLAPGYRAQSWTNGLKTIGINDEALGLALGDRFRVERINRPIVYDEVFHVLNELKSHQYKLLLLTNGVPDLQMEKLAGVPELAPYFDHIVISGAFGVGKPNSAIFEHCMKLLNIKANEGIMIGDKLTTDILGSNRVGMPNAWLNRDGITRTDEIIPRFEITDLTQLDHIIKELS